ncbi:VOC family protein [Companilactobacillus ginsenosidimutans]|uniref:PhnB-like domain-containing protein n=1 Tax=Companilactobacillus ginsenosidimutans TaxID=1007676 RepID=A0A0H4QH34_9LACO|nr:VOC family protein [Companilactobacillus ginsenosidimutans]AKP67719.1 hypothetical protein ABM34_09395 [Companilactobacillus ginsenosidimutans]
MKSITPFLVYNGTAEAAMKYYEQCIRNATITRIDKYTQTDQYGDDGKVMIGVMTIAGEKVQFIDMKHDKPAPPMSWSNNLMLECSTIDEFEQAFKGLADGGKVYTGPISDSRWSKISWITDKFGLTWQLIL